MPATVSLFYDNNRSGFDGTLIAANIPLNAFGYTWTTSGLAEGQEYFIYARVFLNGALVNQNYARWPIVKDASAVPPSAPAMSIDAPGQNQSVTQPFFMGGWAVDLASPSGPVREDRPGPARP